MTHAAGSVEEAARLSALHRLNILDTPHEERFDRITRTATRLFDVPIALVSLVDENRQWFKSCVGLDMSETPRSMSFCAYAIRRDDIFVIADALQDIRFADNPLVTGHPHIRFYAGCPVSGADGSKLGTLCILDQKPRDLTADDAAALRDLAAWAQLELGVIQSLREDLTQERYLMRTLMDNIPDSIYFKDTNFRFTRVNKAMSALFGLDTPEQAIGRTDSDFFSEAHAKQTHRDEQQIIETGRPLIGIEEKEVWPDARERWVLTTKMPLSDNDGKVVGTFGISRDITQNKLAQAALREREQRFQAFMNNSPVVAFMKDEQGRYIYVNATMERFFSADLVGKTDFDWLPAEAARQLHENDMLVLASGRTLEMLEPVPAPDGSTREWLAYKFVMQGEQGQRFVGGVALDITERRRMEEALRESARQNSQLAAAINNTTTGVIITDPTLPDNPIIFANPAFLAITGYTPEEALGRNCRFLQGPDTDPSGVQQIHDALAQRRPVRVVLANYRKDGTQFWNDLTINPVFDANGELISYIGLQVDVTERRSAEEALRQREETLAGIISASPDIITILDMEGRIRSTSPATLDILGYAPEDQRGKSILQLTHEGDRHRLSDLLRATITGRLQEAHLRHRYRHANGEWVLLESNTRLLTDSQGQFAGAVVISRDVTEQAQFEEELRQAKEDADRANQAKSEFLSRMSHELRTPLNAILGFTQLLEMDSTTDDQRESVGHILRAGHHLLNLINEILDISRIEEGRLQMSIEPVLVEEVVQQVLDLVRRQAQQREIRIELPAPGIAGYYVLADRQRLMQVLLNLLSNAVKYNRDDGSVAISCELLADGKLRINVTDTGLGLNQGQVERLFTPFERLGAEQSAIEGTGLGLALSKRLVDAMQGSIEVTSSVGQGSTFSVVLLSAQGRAQRLERLGADLAAVPGLRTEDRQILYIEDNLSNLRLIERILERRTNIRLLSAMQGGLGLELAQEQQPDLIILDMHLPDMQGDEVLQRLQASPETARIPVVILSADATPGQIDRLLAAGATAYLTKPLDVKQFVQLLEEILNAEKGA